MKIPKINLKLKTIIVKGKLLYKINIFGEYKWVEFPMNIKDN